MQTIVDLLQIAMLSILWYEIQQIKKGRGKKRGGK